MANENLTAADLDAVETTLEAVGKMGDRIRELEQINGELLEAAILLTRASSEDESRRWHYSGDRRIENFRDTCPLCIARAAIAKATPAPTSPYTL